MTELNGTGADALDEVERLMAAAIREVASESKSRVGADCMAVAIAPRAFDGARGALSA